MVRAVIRFWKTQAGLSLLPDPEQGLETSSLPSQDNGQRQELVGVCPLHFVQNHWQFTEPQDLGRQLGFSFCCEH